MENIINERDALLLELNKHYQIIEKLQSKLYDKDKKISELTNSNYLDTVSLNDEQKKIVESDTKNMLVIACPGSGKTHCIISRFIYLVTKKGIDSNKIVLISFTKKSGKEIKDRIKSKLPNQEPMYVGTIHGLGYRILQKYDKINYTVLEESESKEMIKFVIDNLIEEEKYIEEDINYARTNTHIIFDKIYRSYPVDFKKFLKDNNLEKYTKLINEIYRKYTKKKKEENVVDYNDLMIRFARLLDTKKGEQIINEVSYMFFDEYQDVNPIQNYILKKFTKSNIMVVGDDAQAIYSFRGSNVDFIYKFTDNFNDSEVFYLEKNYRSSPSIVDFCQHIISFNTKQFDKTVKSTREKIGFKPEVKAFNSSIDEVKWIISRLKNLKETTKYSDIVILTRNNKELEQMELELLKNNFPISKNIGLSLLDKAHVKDFIAFVTIIVNPKSSVHWKRIFSIHKNIGINKANHLLEFSDNVIKSLETLIETNSDYKRNLNYFYEQYKKVKNMKNSRDKLYEIKNYIYNIHLQKSNSNSDGKLNDLNNLLCFVGDSNLEDFVNNLLLNYELDEKNNESILLSTVHSAKGLEWKHVFLMNMTNQTFPGFRSKFYKDEIDNIEEERRLFYVAASRAKDNLYITSNQNVTSNYPVYISPFIKELDQKYYFKNNCDFLTYHSKGWISSDVTNILKTKGYSGCVKRIKGLNYSMEIVNDAFKISYELLNSNYKNKFIIGNFFDYLIPKIIQVNFPNKIKKFELNCVHRWSSFPTSIANKYNDINTDWRDLLNDIFFIASFGNSNVDKYLKNYLLSDTCKEFYINLEKSLIKLVKELDPEEIYSHLNLSYGNCKGELDLLFDDHMIEIKSSMYETSTVTNITQTLLYGHLLNKKNKKINKISIYNILNGKIDTFDTKEFKFSKIYQAIYKN
jgi:DNA helicase II / ATP-dependent DNA helicase PcrA